jgi:hypothetical protein
VGVRARKNFNRGELPIQAHVQDDRMGTRAMLRYPPDRTPLLPTVPAGLTVREAAIVWASRSPRRVNAGGIPSIMKSDNF